MGTLIDQGSIFNLLEIGQIWVCKAGIIAILLR